LLSRIALLWGVAWELLWVPLLLLLLGWWWVSLQYN